jgi:CheY-like chemotaxis protein
MNASGKTILLVEDTDAVIIQMKEILVQQGYKIMVARNGNEALNQIEHQIPDAMILDLMMPEVDGFEVLKRIRNEEKTDHLPVIILTAKYVTKEELAFLKSNSIYQLIQKGDINKDQLLNTVAQMMFPEAVKVDVPATKPSRIPISGTPLVLVVEDNPDNMTTIKALLDGKCQIIEAEDGRTGVEMARKHQPHLILMDIALPGMNGIEALIEIRNDEKLEFVPIIAVSASAMKGDREDFIALGFDSYISKPIDNKAFQAIIAEYLN